MTVTCNVAECMKLHPSALELSECVSITYYSMVTEVLCRSAISMTTVLGQLLHYTFAGTCMYNGYALVFDEFSQVHKNYNYLVECTLFPVRSS